MIWQWRLHVCPTLFSCPRAIGDYTRFTTATPNSLPTGFPLSLTPKVSIRFGGVSTQRKPFNLARSLASDDSWR